MTRVTFSGTPPCGLSIPSVRISDGWVKTRQYEANKYAPSVENRRKIASALGVSLSEFLEAGQILREYNPDDDTWNSLIMDEHGNLTELSRLL